MEKESSLTWEERWSQKRLGDSWVESSFAKKDLRIPVEKKMALSQRCALAAKKANSILGCIRNNIARRWTAVVLPLCLELVRRIWSSGSSSGLPSTRKASPCCTSEGPQR